MGSYEILPSPGTLAAPNYQFETFVPGALNVIRPAVVVKKDPVSRAYGDANPVFTGSLAGLKNHDNVRVVFTCDAGPGSPVGAYPIIATLSDPDGKMANYVVFDNQVKLNVTPAPLTVSVLPASRAYGVDNPAFASTVFGLKNNESFGIAYDCAATAASPVGEYPVGASLSDSGGRLSNYSVTVSSGVLRVAAAELRVTPRDATRVYGATNPVFTGAIDGLRNQDSLAVIYASVATAASPAGKYPIVAGWRELQGGLSNYVVTAGEGVLTVAPAPLTATAFSTNRAYGVANPAFKGSLSGVRNQDAIAVSYHCAATAASQPGAYAIVPRLADPGGKLANYSVSTNLGLLTIDGLPLSLRAVRLRYSPPVVVRAEAPSSWMKVTVNGAVGTRFRLEYSTNWQDWNTALETQLLSESFDWLDRHSATAKERFYRAILLPPAE